MEAVRDFIAVENSGRGIAPAGPSGVAGVQGVDTALALVREAASTAAGDAALWNFREAADFAGTVEELSRALEYLQIVGAGAVDRTRKQATAAPKADTVWTTGWRDDSAYGTAVPGNASGAAAAGDGETAWATGWRDDSGQGCTGPDEASGAVAAAGSGGVGDVVGDLAASGSGGAADSRLAADDGYRNTTEFLIARLRIGAAEARRRLSLAGDLLPRQGFSGDPLPPAREELGAAVAAGEVSSRAASIITVALDRVRHTCDAEAAAGMEHALTRTAAENDPDLLSRVARSWTDALDQDGAEPTEELLRQLQGAFIPSLPAAGGLRPQVMVTIDYRDLLARLEPITTDADLPGNSPADTTASEATGRSFRPGAPIRPTGTMLFTGPVTAATVRKIACDADIIPVLLGGGGRILDIGRASRVFPPHIRKALTARDQGCAFPGCTIPAPWCEAHHITYWSRGGPTGTENGTLLCSHHHHVIHKEQWTIQIRTGIPWFIPPPHIDPRQKPRRNYYFHPADLTTAA